MRPAEKISRLNRLYAVASGINEVIVRVAGEQQLYEAACRIAVERGGFLMAWVGRNDPLKDKLEPVARWGRDDGYIDEVVVTTDPDQREGMGPGGTAFRTGAPAVCNDIAADTQFFASRSQALARGFRSCAAFPLKLEGRPAAVFLVYASEPMYFNESELALLATLAENFSFALEARRTDAQRLRAEAALHASEARLRAVIENEPECVKVVSLAGNVLDMNPAGLAMIEVPSLASVLGEAVAGFIHPEDREAWLTLHSTVIGGGTGQLQVRAIGQQGKLLWMDTHAVPLRGRDGLVESVLYLTRDVTEQRASLERLNRNRALLGIASRLGRIGAWEVELPSLATTWSDELCVIHEVPPGYTPTFDEAAQFYVPAHRADVLEAFQACARDGKPFDLELQIVTSGGRRLAVRSIGEAVRDATGSICRVQGALQDTTDREVAEEEIRHLAEQLTATLESVTDALVTVDRDMTFTYLNPEAERILRRTRAELLGTHMWEQFPEARGTAFEVNYARALSEGRTVEFEAYFEPLAIWAEIRAYPSRNGGLTIYFRDVSERRRAQDEILRLNAELEHRVKQRTAQLEMANQELQAFSYSVAHDLRAPLAAIGGFSQALEKEMGPQTGERALHFLSRMREGVARTSEMIDAILSLAQLSRTQLRWEPVDLSSLATTAAAACREQSPHSTASVSIQPGLRAEGDSRLLQLVMDNLLGNAWKFSSRDPQPEIAVGAHPGPEGETVFFVRDNGVGFDTMYARNMFGAFQRLHSEREFPGTGIGLANVRRIISRHSGRVWAHSRPGEGATFYFTLGDEPA